MESNTSCQSIPNPNTSLAWMPADIASQYEAVRYFYAVVLGVWIWDELTFLPDEVRIFRPRFWSFSNIAYVVSRITTGASILSSFLFLSAPIADCQLVIRIAGWFAAFAMPANSLMFLLRVQGVFHESRLIVGIFSFLWLATCASFTAPFSYGATHIGPSSGCTISSVRKGDSGGTIAVALFDTCVFIAISIRIPSYYAPASSWKERIRSLWNTKNMGQISKNILQTGYLYYMTTVGVNIAGIFVLLAPGISPIVRSTFSVPTIVVQNLMACKVFRLLKLDLLREDRIIMSRSAPGSISTPTRRPNRISADETALSNSASAGNDDIGLSTLTNLQCTRKETSTHVILAGWMDSQIPEEVEVDSRKISDKVQHSDDVV